MIEKKVKQILADQLGIDPNSILLDNDILKDLGADSLDTLEIVMTIEEQFAIKIEDDEADTHTTVQKIIELINKKTH